MVGKIIGSGTMILRNAVGEAKTDSGLKYEICSNMNASPLIRSEQTGKSFSLSWDDVLKLAIEAGIDEPEEDGKEG